MKFLCGFFLGVIVSSVFWILSMAVAMKKICGECVQGVFTRKPEHTYCQTCNDYKNCGASNKDKTDMCIMWTRVDPTEGGENEF